MRVQCLSESAGSVYVAFDVDGTILQLHHELDPFTQSVLLDLKDMGFGITLATGKNMKSTRAVAEKLQIELPLVLSNGCVLQSLDGTIHQKHYLSVDFLQQLIDECERMDIDLAIHINEDIFVKEVTDNLSILFEYGSPTLKAVGEWKTINGLFSKAYKCLVVDRNSREPLFELENRIRSKVGDSVAYCHTLTEMLEFMPEGVSKLTGIRVITEKMGVSLQSVMAFGDGNNDTEMLAEVGFGAVVENATISVKNSADWVIPSCANNGPAQFLQYLMKNRSNPD
jgi:Cof subfamily protein (haloacid dehalogenase superfamily)